ncbi:hypothetical protein PMIN06_011032 [Paraphaeosphaeria minitans]
MQPSSATRIHRRLAAANSGSHDACSLPRNFARRLAEDQACRKCAPCWCGLVARSELLFGGGASDVPFAHMRVVGTCISRALIAAAATPSSVTLRSKAVLAPRITTAGGFSVLTRTDAGYAVRDVYVVESHDSACAEKQNVALKQLLL